MSGVQLRAGTVVRGAHPRDQAPLIEVPSVMLGISEPPTDPVTGAPTAAVWRVRLEAKTETTRKVLGVVHTLPPSAVGGDSNRIVCLATVPGATSWEFQAELVQGTGTENSEAILDMASSPCCGSLGITPVFGALMPWSGQQLFSDVAGPNPLLLSRAQRLQALTARADVGGGTITIVSPAGSVTIGVEPSDTFSADFSGNIIGPGSVTFAGILRWVVETIL